MEIFLKRFGVLIIGIVLAICFFRINGFFSNKKSEIIKSDGLGYYSYLPAIFIYADYTQGFVKEKFPKYYAYTGIPEYMQMVDNKPVDKYFIGTAILMYPFFITTHWLTYYFRQPHDGYSVLYQYFIGLSAVCYVVLGIFFCYRLLRIYGATTYQNLFICTLLVFATNIYFYAVVESTMSHAYSFAAISAFLYFSKEVIENEKYKYIIPAFIALGIVISIRPFNALIVLALPFLSGSFQKMAGFIRLLVRHYLVTLIGGLIASVIISIQLFVWYKQTGHLFVYSYTNERFYFNNPNILNVLFSYQKGLFIYTPLCFLALTGFIFLIRKSKFAFSSLFLFFLLLVYTMSCWHQWYYGSSFGFRPMIDYYSLLALLLLFSLDLFKRKTFRIAFVVLCLLTLCLNQVQAYQYRKFILHWDHMSKFKYWRTFLKTSERWNGYVWNNPESGDLYGIGLSSFVNNFEKPLAEWSNSGTINVGDKAHSGTNVNLLDSTSIYSSTLIQSTDNKLSNSIHPAIIVTGFVHPINRSDCDNLQLVISYEKKDQGVYYYLSRIVDNVTTDKKGWKKFDLALKLGKTESANDVVKVYFWNPEKKSYWIDDVNVEFIDQQ